MKNIRFDLELFGEGAEGCAAEQSSGADSRNSEALVGESTETQETERSSIGDAAADGNIARIGELLGVDKVSEEGIIEYLTQRRARASIDEKLKRRRAEKAYGELISEADRLSSKIKGFDLAKELSDPRFRAMISAGFSIEEAWRASHTDELIAEAREAAKISAVADALEKLRQSGLRPDENGSAGKAPSSSERSVESLTGRGIRDILRRVENGAKIKF